MPRRPHAGAVHILAAVAAAQAAAGRQHPRRAEAGAWAARARAGPWPRGGAWRGVAWRVRGVWVAGAVQAGRQAGAAFASGAEAGAAATSGFADLPALQVVLKGDLPIGVDKRSVDCWCEVGAVDAAAWQTGGFGVQGCRVKGPAGRVRCTRAGRRRRPFRRARRGWSPRSFAPSPAPCVPHRAAPPAAAPFPHGQVDGRAARHV